MAALARRAVLSGAAMAGLSLAAPARAALGWQGSVPAASLKGKAAARGLLFGSMIRQDWVASDPGYAAAIVRDCAIATPGIEAKWWTTEPQERLFDFTQLDQLASELRARNIKWRLHNQVWGIWNPAWVAQALADGRGEAVLAHHIKTVAGRYAGMTAAWDVLNEPADPRWPSGPDGLLRTAWYDALGPRYVDLAFGMAHAADPHATLFVNDDGFEYTTSEAKRTLYLRQLEAWLGRGVPVHGFGLEAHLRPDLPFDPKGYRAFLRELAGMGLTIHITELDVIDAALPADVATRDRMVADAAARFLDVALDERAVRAVVTWGLADQYSDMDQGAPRADGLPTRGAPLDRAFQPKPLWHALANAFDHAPARY